MPAATLSRPEFQAVWSALDLGDVPFPLSGARPSGPEWPVDLGTAFAGLAERGLVVGAQLRDELVNCLTVLALPERSVDAVGRIGHRLAALAATARGVTALAVADGDDVVVTPIREGSLVESVVALLPAMTAGPGDELTVPVAVVRRFLAGDDAGVAPADAAALGTLAEARVRGGQFGVNMADPRSGELFRGIPVVSWFDTTEGRYLMTNDGDTLTVAPADAAVIAVRLHEVLASG
jgi:ESX secretion-associated protein EspG